MTPFAWGLLALAVFAGGFLDAIAGGGGIVTLPAYLLAGLPAAAALGTNKLVAVTGSLTSTLRYARGGLVDRSVLRLAIASFISSVGGALLASHAPERLLRPAVIGLLALALPATLLRPASGGARRPALLWALSGAIGFYDGFFGPGTGTFLIAALAAFGGMDLARAAGSAKLMNFASNLGAVCVFACRGQALPALAASLILPMVAGSWAGASLAVRRGTGLIRALFAVAAVALCAKLAFDLWHA